MCRDQNDGKHSTKNTLKNEVFEKEDMSSLIHVHNSKGTESMMLEPYCATREKLRKEGMVIYDDQCYKIDNFVPHHPGGSELLKQHLGTDISFIFRAMHEDPEAIMKRRKPSRAATKKELSALSERRAEVARAMLSESSMEFPAYVKKIHKFDVNAFEQDMMQLYKSFVSKGYFVPSLAFFIQRNLILLALLSASLSLMRLFPDSFLAPGIMLGLFWHQSGYMMHDGEHHNFPGNERVNDILGWLYGTVFLGVNGAWWREEHREHHALLNTYDESGFKDPQMKEDVWVQNKKLLQFFGDEWIHVVLYIQHITFLPIIFIFGRIGILIDSTLTERKFRPWTIFGNCCHVALIYSIISQTNRTFGVYAVAALWQAILSLQLVGNHYTKPWNKVNSATEGNFALWQILSTQDFSCPPYIWWMYGGLNFHYSHHVFPKLSREFFYITSPLLKAVCDKHGVPNVRIGFLNCCLQMVQNFRNIAEDISKQGHRGLAQAYT